MSAILASRQCMIVIAIMLKPDVLLADLNLMKLLHALIEERSVTRAGARIGLSQPAASRGLARLRHLLDDRLVVRTPAGLVLTPRAEALAAPVRDVLGRMKDILSPVEFDPSSATGRISIAANDRIGMMLAPALVSQLAVEATLLQLDLPQPSGDNVGQVTNGSVDLALGVFDELPAGLFRRVLFEEDYVCLVRGDHPAAGQVLTPASFAAMSHVTVQISGMGESAVDLALAGAGLRRQIAARVPHFVTAVAIVAESNMVISLPARLARRFATAVPVSCLPMPIPIPPITTTMIWHERRQDDPLHQWLRNQIVRAAERMTT